MTDTEGLQDIKQYFPNGVTTAMKKTFYCNNESYLLTSSACWSGITKEVKISLAAKYSANLLWDVCQWLLL